MTPGTDHQPADDARRARDGAFRRWHAYVARRIEPCCACGHYPELLFGWCAGCLYFAPGDPEGLEDRDEPRRGPEIEWVVETPSRLARRLLRRREAGLEMP